MLIMLCDNLPNFQIRPLQPIQRSHVGGVMKVPRFFHIIFMLNNGAATMGVVGVQTPQKNSGWGARHLKKFKGGYQTY